MYIKYHVHPPQLVEKDTKHSEVAKEMIQKAKGSNSFNIAAIQHYTKTSNGTPFDLFKISMKAHVYKIDDDVVACYEDEEHFYDAKFQYASDVSAVKHILRVTMTVEVVHYVDNAESLFQGYNAIMFHYEKEKHTSKLSAKRRLQKIQYRDLNSYINVFRKRFAEFKLHGGTDSREIIKAFMFNLPNNKFHLHKTICNTDTLNDTISHFLKVAANMCLRCPKQEFSKTKEISINKTEIMNTKTFQPKKQDDYEDTCDHNDIEESNLEPSFTPSDDEDETTPYHLNFNILKMNINIRKNIVEDQPCNCRFRNLCIKALLNSGLTRHVTGDKHLLRNTSPETRVSLSGELEEVNFDTVKGNIHILLLNTTVLQLKDVVYVPMLKEKQTIISESLLVDDGYAVHKDQRRSTLTKNGYTVFTFERQKGHFFLHGTNNPENNIVILRLNISATDLMHYRLGHINVRYILSTELKPMTQSYSKLDEVGTINSAYEKFVHQTSRYSTASNIPKIDKVVQHTTQDILKLQEHHEETAELSADDHSKEEGKENEQVTSPTENTEAFTLHKSSNNTLGSFDISQENVVSDQRLVSRPNSPTQVIKLGELLKVKQNMNNEALAKVRLSLISAGLKPLLSEKGLFTNERREKKLIVLVYVDDLLNSGEEKEVYAFENMMSERFKLTSSPVAETYV
eukprot:augustus_masked-scaffold_30-processed-gene-3.2-mRNA-1 protein AED:1.00 eAED:1.00 QI:0/0/0/0/1/1/5/0/682